MDIHNHDLKYNSAKEKVKSRNISSKNKELILEFVNDLILCNISKPRLCKYFCLMGMIAEKLTLGRYDITGRFIFKNLDSFNDFKEDFYAKFGDYVKVFISDDYYDDID